MADNIHPGSPRKRAVKWMCVADNISLQINSDFYLAYCFDINLGPLTNIKNISLQMYLEGYAVTKLPLNTTQCHQQSHT